MAHKPQMKTAASDPKLSNTTVAFLNAQNQDLHTKSIVQTSLLVTLPELMQAPTLPLPPLETPKAEEDSNNNERDIHLFNNTLTSLILWCRKDSFNKETDSDTQDTLIKRIFKVAKDFNLVTIITLPTPSPSPPCTQPHSNEEDIHMELPTPTCVFSKAATQTPAPLPVLAMPTPPPLPVMSAPAASTSSKPGLPSRPSFAKAVAKTLCPNAPPFVRGPPHAPQPPIKATQGPVSNKCLKRPYFATHGPSRHQFYIETSSATDLNIVEAMLPPKIARSRASLPSSQSFIKIMDIPYFKPGTMEPPNRQEIGNWLIPSPIPVDMIKHTWFIHNSPKADSSTFWINLMDLQQGTLTSSLIGR
ncbi:hypothetical protein P691DRAFT_789960 [Macrolepiota fuliginosa MF-IS2]|uniref:Uncharacterized protein n=1 Tax=Macrolepiota fuliginosa MF-IS2 TaxID=1400762 RepID=A0A9P6BXY7_9AGAR|nr:hypothetical protein P691DRAFT_789960 [Macrolepiota fuliginosa MF-IS2]